MSWINKQIAKIAPAFAIKREIAQIRLDRLDKLKKNLGRATFDAVGGGRQRYDFLSSTANVDTAVASDSQALRQQIRKLEFNNGFVSGPIQRIVNNVVGNGFSFQSRVKADEGWRTSLTPSITKVMAEQFNNAVEYYLKKWMERSDSRLINTFAEQTRIVEGALIRDGEVLIVGRTSKRKERIVQHCLETLEIDRLATPMSEITNPKIKNGILFDDEGAPKTYYISKAHPGDGTITVITDSDFIEVPAFNANGTRNVIHLYNPIRPEQTRGFASLASALKDIQDLDRYREAELFAALEDACMTGIVTTENPLGWAQAGTTGSGGEEYERIKDFAPGEWNYMRPGESVDIHSPQRPNTQFGEMTDQLLRGPANSLDIPPEILTQNWAGMNYSNARTVLLMFYLSCRVRQIYLTEHFLKPTYDNVLRDLIVKGLVKAPGFDRRADAYLTHSWIPNGWEWIDPVKEAKGKELGLKNNFETLTSILAGSGKDLEETLEQRAKELKYIKELEEKYKIKLNPEKGTNGQEATEKTEEGKDGNGKMKVVK